MSPILVTGGTGTLGRAVVRRLTAAGREARVLSRQPAPAEPMAAGVQWVTGDLSSGVGLGSAVSGVDAILHCASDGRRPRNDLPAARHLIDAAAAAGGPHLVYISIVGVDRVPLPYYGVKLQVERLIERSGLPWTILRTTQFHDLVLLLCRTLARLPVMPVPGGTRVQPIEVDEVAARLVELAGGEPRGRVPDLGGPQQCSFAELARSYLRVSGRRRLVLPVHLPGKAARGYRQGGHLAPGHAEGRRSFEDFLLGQP